MDPMGAGVLEGGTRLIRRPSSSSRGTRLLAVTLSEHAIVVYESDEVMEQVIACGNVGGILKAQMAGMIMPGDELIVWQGVENESGYVGFATLRSVEGGKLDVAITLSDSLHTTESGQANEHDVGTPASTLEAS